MNARISARARDDLEHIYAFIYSRQGEQAAEKFLHNAREAVTFLENYPEAGPHPRWATRHKTLRFWLIGRTNFIIYYLPDEYGISIERVLDGRRDTKRIMQRRLEEPPSAE